MLTARAHDTPDPEPAPTPAMPAMFLAGRFRQDAIQAIGILNRAITWPADERGWDAAYTADPEGYAHLLRARGEIVRALVPPADRAREYRFAQRAVAEHSQMEMVAPLGRVMRAHVLELAWCVRNAYVLDSMPPGAFFMPRRDWQALDRIGVDPAVLR